MIKISQHKLGIQQGDTVLFSDFEHDGVMWTGDGPRQTRLVVIGEAGLDRAAITAALSG